MDAVKFIQYVGLILLCILDQLGVATWSLAHSCSGRPYSLMSFSHTLSTPVVVVVVVVVVVLFHERGNPFSQGWYKWGTLRSVYLSCGCSSLCTL